MTEKKQKKKDDADPEREKQWVLWLYVAGQTPKSLIAFANLKKIWEEHLKGRYELEIIDIYQKKTLDIDEQIIAAPALIKKLPLPLRKIIGDMSDKKRALLGLDLVEKKWAGNICELMWLTLPQKKNRRLMHCSRHG